MKFFFTFVTHLVIKGNPVKVRDYPRSCKFIHKICLLYATDYIVGMARTNNSSGLVCIFNTWFLTNVAFLYLLTYGQIKL
jgi:hypothetical protein